MIEHRPAGTPDGGQFAPKPSSESSPMMIQMGSDEDYSFEYPPYPKNADELVKFWSTVSLPDGIVENINEGLVYHAKDEVDAKAAAWGEKNEIPLERGGMGEEAREATRIWYERKVHYANQIRAQRKLPPHNAKNLVRAAKMYDEASKLPSEQAEAVRNAQMQLPDRSVTTPAEVWRKYNFGLIRDRFTPIKDTSIEDALYDIKNSTQDAAAASRDAANAVYDLYDDDDDY